MVNFSVFATSAKHHLRPCLPCGLVLQLEYHQLRDGELLRLRDLRVGDLPQLGEHRPHLLRLQLRLLCNL